MQKNDTKLFFLFFVSLRDCEEIENKEVENEKVENVNNLTKTFFELSQL